MLCQALDIFVVTFAVAWMMYLCYLIYRRISL